MVCGRCMWRVYSNSLVGFNIVLDGNTSLDGAKSMQLGIQFMQIMLWSAVPTTPRGKSTSAHIIYHNSHNFQQLRTQ